MFIEVKPTHEVTASEWDEILSGFNAEFETNKTVEELVAFYRSSALGHSFHAVARNEQGKLAGFTSAVPRRYGYQSGRVIMTALSTSSFVRKEFRTDALLFSDLYQALRAVLAKLKFDAVLGVPNKNSVEYLTRLMGFTILFDLNYYLLPVRINRILKSSWIRWLNPVFVVGSRLFVELAALGSWIANPKERRSVFHIVFEDNEFKSRFGKNYESVTTGSIKVVYRIFLENDVRVAYLIDFREKGIRSFRALSKSVRHIVSSHEIDVIAYVGKLELSQWLLFRLPKGKVPRKLPLAIDVIADEKDPLYGLMQSASNWDFGLLNLDVR